MYLAERAMRQVAARLGQPFQVAVEPYRISAVIGPAERGASYIVPVTPGGANIGRMVRLMAIGDALLAGRLDAAGALRAIDAAAAPRSPAHPLQSLVIFALLSLAISVLLGGGWREIIAAGIGGCTAGLTLALGRRLVPQASLMELFAAIAATAVGIGVSLVIGPFSTLITVAAALIALLPGYVLFLGTIEIARGYPAAGLQRLASGSVSLLALGSGVAVGAAFIGLAPGLKQPVQAEPAPGWALVLAYACYVLGVYLMLNARREDLPWIAASCLIGALGVGLGNHLPNSDLGTFLAALIVGVAGRVGTRWVGLPPAVLVVPGTIFLLPGSLAFRGVLQILDQNVQVGVEFAFQALLTIVLISGGLIIGVASGRPTSLLRT